MKKRRVFVSVVAVFLALLMLFSLVASALGFLVGAVSQSDVDQLQNQKTTLNQQKNAKKAALDALRTQQAGFVEMKAALDEKNELAQQEILVTEEQIAMYNEMIAEKETEAQAAQAAADEQLELYKVHLRAME